MKVSVLLCIISYFLAIVGAQQQFTGLLIYALHFIPLLIIISIFVEICFGQIAAWIWRHSLTVP